MQLLVPYYSQFVDVQDPFWMIRACGACALKMVCEFYGKEVPELIVLCNEAKDRGGYHMENGWVHDYLVTKATELGLHAFRQEGQTTLDDVKTFLASGKPVIVSVEKRVLEQRRFHIIVLTGFEDGTFFYHESESTTKEKGRNRACSEDLLLEYWRGKSIFIEA